MKRIKTLKLKGSSLKISILFWLLLHLTSNILIGQHPTNNFTTLTTEDGLADNWCHEAMMDSRGIMWFASQDGLSRFDGKSFHNYRRILNDSTSLSGNIIMDLEEDDQGLIWLAINGGGLNSYDPVSDSFKSHHSESDNSSTSCPTTLTNLHIDEDKIWLGSYNEGLNIFDKRTGAFTKIPLSKTAVNQPDAPQKNSVVVIEADKVDPTILWLGGADALYRYDKSNNDLERIPFQHNGKAFDVMTVYAILPLSEDRLALATHGGGVCIFDYSQKTFEYFVESESQWALQNGAANVIMDLKQKSSKELWVCSRNSGFGYLNIEDGKYQFYKSDKNDDSSLPINESYGVYIDKQERLWILNFRAGISILDPSNQLFDYVPIQSKNCTKGVYLHPSDVIWNPELRNYFMTTKGCEGLFQYDENFNEITSNATADLNKIYLEFNSLLLDSSNDLYIGGNNSIGSADRKTNAPSVLKYNAIKKICETVYIKNNEGFDIANYSVNDLAGDSKGNIWLGTAFGGLVKWNPKSNLSKQYIASESNPDYLLPSYEISEIVIDKNDNIWLATHQFGVFFFDSKKESFTNYGAYDDLKSGLVEGRVNTLAIDQDGNIWLGTNANGIQIIEPGKSPKSKWKSYRFEDGLPDEKIMKIAADQTGNMWISTLKGLVKYSKEEDVFYHYNKTDGLKDPFLMEQALVLTSNNELILGQNEGFYHFNPSEIYKNETPPEIIITSFSVNEVKKNFEKEINFTDKITLSYDENFFSINFAALNYSRPEKNRYAYQLEGYDKDWILPTDNRTRASYTDVREGNYTFKVKAANNDGIWSEQEKAIRINIKPPFWRSIWAYLFYICAIAGILYAIYSFQLKRRLADEEAKRLKEIDLMKSRLYANITHEFRTPLTLILGPVQKNIKNIDQVESASLLQDLKMVERNSKQLLQLINQMLDLSKLEAGALKVKYLKGDLIYLIKYFIESYHSYAASKNIDLNFNSDSQELILDYDREKLFHIFSNLISNAIKFTPSGGEINVRLTHSDSNYRIEVKDSGEGISAEELPHIFDRFYQVDDSSTRKQGGTGIGLSLTKELVDLLEGTMEVTSQLNSGTTFLLTFPRSSTSLIPDDMGKPEQNFIQENEVSNQLDFVQNGNGENEQLPLILIVEDNPDVANYIGSCFHKEYRLAYAENGEIGIEKAIELIPDLIISDVMMPKKNGYEVCNTLKENEKTSHIPIIMLTAKADINAKIHGLKKGADAYLSKPFNEEELSIRVLKLLELRKLLQKRFGQQIVNISSNVGKIEEEEQREEVQVEAIEDVFIGKVRTAVEEHLLDPSLDVNKLCQLLGMSRTQLHRKLTALTGESTTKLIRKIRLNKAEILLHDQEHTVSEIAYKVGFSDPAYFTRTFTKEFGKSPSQYRTKLPKA